MSQDVAVKDFSALLSGSRAIRMRLIVFQTKPLGLPVSVGAFPVNRLLAANHAIAMIKMK
jgi:hypothetical protein